MIYKDFQGKKLSALGLGAMRLPVVDEDNSRIDMDAVREMVAYAMEKGINYYDTAWGYHGGNSELAMGEVLSEYPRESFYLASKFPGYDVSTLSRVEEIFEKQLEKCRVEYFDFYLFHNVCEKNIDGYLDPKYGIFDYLIEQKRNGRIKHLGFSTHGSFATMERFLKAYGEHMEFGQIQLNWLDYEFQKAKEKVEMLKAYNIPVWVMEPVRGGKLAVLSPEQEEILAGYRDEKAPAWAFRFLQTIPEVTVTLSGMSNMEQLKENINTYSEDKPLTEKEWAVLQEFAEDMICKTALPCTSCKYCITHCPKGIAIPQVIELYNKMHAKEPGFDLAAALADIPKDKRPSECVGCKSCEQVCPQQIKIADMMGSICKNM